LAHELGQGGESLSLTAPYLDLAVAVATGSPTGLVHGGRLSWSIALGGVPQSTLTPAYLMALRPSDYWLFYAWLGVPILTAPDLNAGGELAVGATYFIRSGVGAGGRLLRCRNPRDAQRVLSRALRAARRFPQLRGAAVKAVAPRRAPLAGRRVHGLAIFLAVVFGMAPTVGDIGSCNQDVDPLDPATFFALKASIDCTRCRECELSAKPCQMACSAPPPTSFPRGCAPLVHDGEVCLHALLHASCDDYASYTDEAHPTAPSECQFCPLP
jgi:hypothetical protein